MIQKPQSPQKPQKPLNDRPTKPFTTRRTTYSRTTTPRTTRSTTSKIPTIPRSTAAYQLSETQKPRPTRKPWPTQRPPLFPAHTTQSPVDSIKDPDWKDPSFFEWFFQQPVKDDMIDGKKILIKNLIYLLYQSLFFRKLTPISLASS